MAGRALKVDPRKSIQRTDFAEHNPLKPVNEKTIAESVPTDIGREIPCEPIDKNAIAALAFQLWLDRGGPIGSDQEDWLQAERELRGSFLKTA